MASKPSSPEVTGKVVRFERRRPDQRPLGAGAPADHSLIPPLPPASRDSEPSEEPREDFRHRMKTNAATLLIVAVLIWCGLWLADTLAALRKTQDCLLTGRRNCAPITVPDRER